MNKIDDRVFDKYKQYAEEDRKQLMDEWKKKHNKKKKNTKDEKPKAKK